ncbi:MAG: ABC transporter permease subunit [Promethearchaeia archaeon]
MNKENLRVKKFRLLVISFIALFVLSIIIQNSSTFRNETSDNSENSLKTSIVYDGFINETVYDAVITETVFIMDYASVTFINSTFYGNIYTFNNATLNIGEGSNITENNNIVISDFSRVNIENSTITGSIECRDSSTLNILSSQTPFTKIWKFGSADITIVDCSLDQLNEFGLAGQILILNSSINEVWLNGLSSSMTYINNSNISFFNDLALPLNYITGPISLNLLTFQVMYQTSERSINLTWIGWDSPIIDGYLNITFQILVDGQIYDEINGSGFHENYIGILNVNFNSTGFHNISVVSIDSFGNNFTSTITIEIIEYPSFQWTYFGIGIIIIAAFVIISLLLLRRQQNRGYYSSIGIIFKKELTDSKIKVIIFMIIGAAPGIILYFIFGMINRLVGGINIDQIRSLMTMVLNFYLLYFGIAFSIVFASSSIIGAKRSGSLSWFLSKPVRRWEFLWGKILTYMLVVILVMIPTSISFTLSGISFVDEIYVADLVSIGGYIFIIGLMTLIPLMALSVLCSTLFKKTGLAIFIPILLLMIVPTLVSFLPILAQHEWPLLFSYSYYFEKLGSFWISSSGGGLSSILAPYAELFGFTITTIALSPTHIILILSSITIICLTVSTFYLQKIDIT